MTAVRREGRILLFALTFLTRIPSPVPLEFSRELLNRAARYFPLIGLFIGLISAGVFAWASLLLPIGPAVLLAMIASVLATGAFHEDGLADTFDGFARGDTRDEILAAMKDSRLRAPGALAIAVVLLLKFFLLGAMSEQLIIAAFLSVHALSRAASASLIHFGDYARGDTGKSRLLAVGMTRAELLIALTTGLAPALMAWLILDEIGFAAAIPAAFLTALVAAVWFKHKLDGFTGDCLGAVQQLSEIAALAAVFFSTIALS